MKTRSQEYSQTVFDQLSRLQFNDTQEKEYGRLCHKFPLMVLRNGLSQAVAFVWVKSISKKGSDQGNNEDSAQGMFLRHLSELTIGKEGESAAAFQQRINSLELVQYQRMTREILAASIWYKRFAESLLGVPGGENDD